MRTLSLNILLFISLSIFLFIPAISKAQQILCDVPNTGIIPLAPAQCHDRNGQPVQNFSPAPGNGIYCYVNGQHIVVGSRGECITRQAQANNQSPNIQTQNQKQTNKTNNMLGIDKDANISEYIKAIYNYGIGIVGILATVVIMIGGLIWITSMGNAQRVSSAKEWISAALTGLALAMFSYTLLWIINPDLVKFSDLSVPTVGTSDSDSDNGGGWTDSSNCCVSSQQRSVTCTTVSKETDCSAIYFNKSCSDIPQCHMASESYSAKKCPQELLKDGKCKPCENCTSLTVPVKNKTGTYANDRMVQALNNVNGPQNWQVTEAWPPTVAHQSRCHQTGGCVDINFTKQPTIADVHSLYQRLVAVGLKPIYERTDNCNNYPRGECTVNVHATAPHFHVNQ